MNLRFEIPILPKAQKRGRAGIIKSKDGRVFSHVYKDKSQRIEEDNFRALLYEHRPEKPHEGPIWLQVIINLPIPASKPKKFKSQAVANLIKPTTKPDLDNLVKHLKDCMKGIFYLDDKQIYLLQASKIYSESPGWAIYIRGE